jgi:hypothetical protein
MGNIVLYHSIIFLHEIRYILGSVKVTKSHKKDKNKFFVYYSSLFTEDKILIFLFLLNPKYNIFHSEKLHTDEYNILYTMVFL